MRSEADPTAMDIKVGGAGMKIQSSNVNLSANSFDSEKTSIKRTITKQNNAQAVQQRNQLTQQFRDQLNDLKKSQIAQGANEVSNKNGSGWVLSDEDLQKIALLERLLSELTGKEVKFIIPSNVKINEGNYNGVVNQVVSRAPAPALIYNEEVTFQKRSKLEFNGSGTVTTQDGRQIEFNLNIQASREINFKRSTTVVEGQLQDPLVLSFDGKLPELTQEKYEFDLDNDGRSDQISFLTKGSGFLALDINKDGTINNGSELFGPNSGSGFQDLSVYDSDINGWIDENDPIFDGLRIWTKDENGKDQLFALGEKGIGAIFLGAVSTQFDLLNNQFAKDGVIRESGIYLNENGTAGGIHHVDIKL